MHESKVFYRTLVACSTVVVITACLASWAAERDAEAGAQALPDGPRTLENLLREADEQAYGKPQSGDKPVSHQEDWKWEPENAPNQPAKPAQPTPDDQAQPLNRPAALQALAPLPVVNINDLQVLIDRRNDIIDDCNFFATLKEIVQQEQKLRKLKSTQKQATFNRDQAVNEANILNGPGANLMLPAIKANAKRQAAMALANLERVEGAVAVQQQVLQSLYERITPHIGPWVRVYRDMAKFVAPRRNDPNRQAVLHCLERAVNQRDDFFEGRVLAAYCHAYDGRIQACDNHLCTAISLIDECAPVLYFAQVTHDCAYVCIIAGQPDRVKPLIQILNGLPRDQQSLSQLWLVASYSVATKKENDAATYFMRALAKMGFFKKPANGQPAAPIDPMLAGDAAHFFLTQTNPVDKQIENAKNLVNRVGQNDAWQMMRAQAALAARQKRWPAAQQVIAACEEECPLTLQAQVAAETQAYLGNREWIRNAK